MQVTLTMSQEEFDEYQAKINGYNATIISNDTLRAYSEKLERDIAEFKEASAKIASYLYLSPYDNYISVDTKGYKAIRELLGLESFEEAINESVNTSDESVSETNQTGPESSSD